MMNLRLATPRLDRAGDRRVRGRHPPGSGVRDGVGGARRRLQRSRARSSASPTWCARAMEMERRALAIDPDLADAHTWLGAGAADARPHRRGDRGDPRGDPPRARQRPGAPGAGPRATGSARGTSPRRFPMFERAIELNPEAGYSYLQLGLLLAWEGQLRARPSESAGARSSSRISTSPATPACRWSAPTRGSATSTTCRGATTRRSREYERGLAFVGVQRSRAQGSHARSSSTSRSAPPITGRGGPTEAARHFERALQDVRRPRRQGRRRSRSPATTSPACTR